MIIKISSLIAALLIVTKAFSQELVVDPATSAAIAVNAGMINGQLNTTNDKLNLIGQGQLAVSSQLVLVNNLQNRIYKGLSEVAAVINNLYTVKDIAECGSDIVNDVGSAVSMARSNPVLLLFAEQGARDFDTRAGMLAADVSAFVLKPGANNLMDSGERGRLLNHIADQMRILRGIAFGMNRAIYWAKMNGIFRSLNPWAEWQNQDTRIANEVLNNAKYLKK
ncbi:hypothetical protein MTO98_25800 [Mucilaginibacter sp. SMC90]|uniref:hypothetical protein n=1 Tax=Mucilaginibacter sp. SMC90 TaxID=2929803 RepID=UPI001FB1C7DF|nr:hypothetical protein [Mucilaginibacter sp. SMC90]UOE47828.1 hypothetical protein MTO98_25800 [Mucilaginibacter sp. SMC90]